MMKPIKDAADETRHRQRETTLKKLLAILLSSVVVLGSGAALAQGKPPLKLGAILDMSGLYADITGPGSETAAKMAVEDFGG